MHSLRTLQFNARSSLHVKCESLHILLTLFTDENEILFNCRTFVAAIVERVENIQKNKYQILHFQTI